MKILPGTGRGTAGRRPVVEGVRGKQNPVVLQSVVRLSTAAQGVSLSFFGAIVDPMFSWLRKWLHGPTPAPWRVQITDQGVAISDGQGTEKTVPIDAIRRVIVATDDSGPWGADVVFLIFASGAEPVGLFPLEAQGCDDFVGWLANRPGYRDRELAAAMSSTRCAEFVVLDSVE